MLQTTALTRELTSEDFAKLKRLAVRRECEKGSQIFSEGDTADHLYFIETGLVSVFIQEFTVQEEISVLGPGDHFGEMAFFHGDKRSASVVALTDTALLCVDRTAFLDLYQSDRDIAAKIDKILVMRSDELTSRETLIEGIGIHNKVLRIGIKGDPSLRESAFTRERHQSVVDQFLPLLQPHLLDLLLHRCVYEISIHFNSGELHIGTVFDPFNSEIHPAAKLINKAYVERHFPIMAYDEKVQMLRRTYAALSVDPGFECLPQRSRDERLAGFVRWEPVKPETLVATVSKLSWLRKIPDFYLRHFTIGMIRDALRMQFNCDGTHIISTEGFAAFLNQNLPPMDELYQVPQPDRRKTVRIRRQKSADDVSPHYSERRTPPGRRQQDWDAMQSHPMALT